MSDMAGGFVDNLKKRARPVDKYQKSRNKWEYL